MKGSMTREGALRITSYILLVLVIIAAAWGWMQHTKAEEAQAELDGIKKVVSDAATASSRTSAQLKTMTSRMTQLEQQGREMDTYKAIFAKIEPEVVPVLEAAGRSGKPATRAAALTTAGIIGQIAHGPDHEPAASAFDRALVIEKENCGAIVAMNMGGKKVDLPEDCKSMMPAAAAAPSAAPAGGAAKAEPMKGGDAGKAAEKSAEPAKK
jgi:hypothetical protein